MPIVVTGLSTTSSPSTSPPTPPTSSTQEIEGSIPHPTSIECESADRQARRNPLHKPSEIPKPNKNEDHELAQGNPVQSDIPEWLQEFRENLVDERVPEYRDSHTSPSHRSSFEPKRKVVSGKHSIYTHTRKTEIARSARGLKLQGPRAEDVPVKSHLVQTILVT